MCPCFCPHTPGAHLLKHGLIAAPRGLLHNVPPEGAAIPHITQAAVAPGGVVGPAARWQAQGQGEVQVTPQHKLLGPMLLLVTPWLYNSWAWAGHPPPSLHDIVLAKLVATSGPDVLRHRNQHGKPVACM
jgi:hypothetical protein